MLGNSESGSGLLFYGSRKFVIRLITSASYLIDHGLQARHDEVGRFQVINVLHEAFTGLAPRYIHC